MLVCGIDIGTTNLKVGLVDEAGALVAVKTMATPRRQDGIGPVTDAADLMQAVERLLLAAWRAAARPEPLAAIATTGVGEDGLFLDARRVPLAPAIPWFDRRASAEAAEIRRGGAAAARSGIVMDPTRTGPKWLWSRRHRPEVSTAAEGWAALTDYPLIAWGAAPFMSQSLASRTGCYDPSCRDWIAPLLAFCAAPPLPPVRVAGEVVGRMRAQGLVASGAVSPETLLVAGGHDHPVAASAIRRLAPLARIDSLGTANVLYAETAELAEAAPDPLVACSVPVSGGAGLACLGVIEFSGALAAAGDSEAVRGYLAGSPLGGEPAPPRPLGSPGPAGIREVLEAATMTARVMLDRFAARGVPGGPLYATGGWSRSRGLLQLRASILGAPVHTAREAELSLVGAALLAAEAAGAKVSFCPEIAVIGPDPGWAAAYDSFYPGFLAALNDTACAGGHEVQG